MSDKSDETWDSEGDIFKLFDPDNVTEWLKYSPKEFIQIMILELRQQNVAIEKWAELVDGSPDWESTELTINAQTIPARFFTQTILRSVRILHRLLDTTRAYAAEISEDTSKE
jgi:hypothetical protein